MEIKIEEQLKTGGFDWTHCGTCPGHCCDRAGGVQLTESEYLRIVPHLEGISKLADDPRVAQRIVSGKAIRLYKPTGYYETGSTTRNGMGFRSCVFKSHDRKCTIHAYALENGIPVSEIKPIPCQLYPIEQVYKKDEDTLHVRISKRSLCDVVKKQNKSEWYVEEAWTDNEKEALRRVEETAHEHQKTTGYRY